MIFIHFIFSSNNYFILVTIFVFIICISIYQYSSILINNLRARHFQIVVVLLQGVKVFVEIHESHIHQIDQICLVLCAEVSRVEHVHIIDFVHFADFEGRYLVWRWLNLLWSEGLRNLMLVMAESHGFVFVIFDDVVWLFLDKDL